MAVTTVGEMEIRLNAAVGQFEQKMNQATGTISKIGKVALGIGGALAATFSVGTVKAFADEIMRAYDETAKFADAVNANFEAYQQLQYAAELYGAQGEEIDKAFIRMQKSIGDGSDAFRRLGLDISKLKAMKADEALLAISGAMNDLDTRAERISVGMQIFGRQYVNMATMIAEGDSFLKVAMDEAEKLGTVLSRTDAAKLEEVNDNFTRMSAAIRGLGSSILVSLAPSIQVATDAVVDFMKGAASGEKAGTTSIAGGLGQFWNFISKIQSVATNPIALFQIATAGSNKYKDVVPQGPQTPSADEMRIMGFAEDIKEKFGVADFAQQYKDLDAAMQANLITAGEYESALTDLQKKDPAYIFAEQSDKLMEAAIEETRKLAEGIAESTVTPWEKAQANITQATDFLGRGLLTLEEHMRYVGEQMKKSPAYEFWDMLQEKMKSAAERMRADADAIRQSVKTPIEAFREQMAKVNELFSLGAIDRETAMRAELKAREELYGQGADTSTTAGNVLGGAGDFGAQAAISELKRRGVERNKQEAMLREAQKQSRYLQSIAQNTGQDMLPVFG